MSLTPCPFLYFSCILHAIAYGSSSGSNPTYASYKVNSQKKFSYRSHSQQRKMLNRSKGVCKGRGLGLKPPWSWYFTKPLSPAQRDWLFSHTFCLLICRLNANTTEWICMQISSHIVNVPKYNNEVFVGIWVNVFIQKPCHHFLQTFRPLRLFKILFSDSSLYRKQLSLFCLLWLSTTSADRIRYSTNFWSMIKLLQLKNSSC